MPPSAWSPPFASVLKRLGDHDALGESRFVARNFQLERRLSNQRRDGYEAGGIGSVSDYPTLETHHSRYLARSIFRVAPARGIPRVIEPVDAPATFTMDPLDDRFRGAADDLRLIRVITLRSLATLSDRTSDEVRAALGDPVQLADMLEDYNERLRLQPSFAGFWEDVADLTPEDPSEAAATWADDLRDVFGLWLLVPPPGGLAIIVLRYLVEDVPRIKGRRGSHPLVEPTVLDADLHVAFCPAPERAPAGCLVNLAGDLSREPAGELLHPTMPLRPSHVFRSGNVEQAPDSLARARAAHITFVQDLYDPAFAADTDADLLVGY